MDSPNNHYICISNGKIKIKKVWKWGRNVSDWNRQKKEKRKWLEMMELSRVLDVYLWVEADAEKWALTINYLFKYFQQIIIQLHSIIRIVRNFVRRQEQTQQIFRRNSFFHCQDFNITNKIIHISHTIYFWNVNS